MWPSPHTRIKQQSSRPLHHAFTALCQTVALCQYPLTFHENSRVRNYGKYLYKLLAYYNILQVADTRVAWTIQNRYM